MSLAPLSSLHLLTAPRCAELRQRFARAGFNEQAVADAERIAPGQFDPVRLPLVRWRLARQATPAAALTNLFVYGADVPEAALDAALGSSLLTALTDAGWLTDRADSLRSLFRVLPFEGLWFLHDDPAAGAEAVMGPGPTTLQLVRWTGEVTGCSVLDVGCGAGTLALVASRRGARRALGTDVNARAIDVAAFNARLNGVEAEFRVGSLFEPLKGERFDRVLAQPPYVTLPPNLPQVTYLHGGAHGDELAMKLLAGLDAAVAPRGQALMLFDSAVRQEPLIERVRAALGTAALDVVLLTAKGMSADLQSIAYATVSAGGFGEAYDACVTRYREHLAALKVSEFSHALFSGRRVDEARFAVGLPVPSLAHPAAGALDDLFAALELAGSEDAALLLAAVRPAPGVTWLEERDAPDSALQPRFRVALPVGAIGADRELAEASYVLLAALCASATVRDAVATYAEACGASATDVQDQALSFVREGLATGLLTPARVTNTPAT